MSQLIPNTKKRIYLTAALLSLMLSFWSAFKETVINTDAICYLKSAESMSGGLNTAMHLCGQAQWPFFSMLIYAVSKILHVSSLFAANILDAGFSLLSVLMFIRIVQFFKPTVRMLWLAAAVILLAHEFNSIRVYIVRDHGFWAFYLTSIVIMLHYFQTPRFLIAASWSLSLIAAMLFRIEGLIFLLLMPWIAWFSCKEQWSERFKKFLQLNTLLVLLGAIAICVMLFQTSAEFGRVDEVKYQLLNGFQAILENFNVKAQALATHVLNVFSEGDAKSILFLMLLGWYIVSVIANVSTVYAVLIAYAWVKKIFLHKVLWAYLAINIIITSTFLLENMFLSKRYLLALSLVLMVWVPFGLDKLIQEWNQRRWPVITAVFFIFIASLGGIFDFGYSKAYLRQAGEWAAENIPVNASFYSNDYQVMYYSSHFTTDLFEKAALFTRLTSLKDWQQFDYVALRSDAKHPNTQITLPPLKIFKNKRGDQISIYKVSH